MDVTITINGLDKMRKLAEKYPATAEKYVNTAILKSLGAVYGNMASITPVKTARLREDFHTPHVSRFQGWIGSSLPYAIHVHNLYSPGTPYKRPSLNKSAIAGFLTYGANESKGKINGFFNDAIAGTLKEISQ